MRSLSSAVLLTFIDIYLALLAPPLTLVGFCRSSARYARAPKKCPRAWDFQMRAAREKMRAAREKMRPAHEKMRPAREKMRPARECPRPWDISLRPAFSAKQLVLLSLSPPKLINYPPSTLHPQPLTMPGASSATLLRHRRAYSVLGCSI